MNADHWERVQDLFLRASEMPEEARLAFLREQCTGDEDARREAESLLAAEAEADADARLRSIVRAAALDVQTDETARAVGRRIGPYVIEKEIGRGGMGTVYLAFRDDDQFRQRVAIKVVSRGMDSESGLLWFRRERQMLADLQHPNIARLLDGGATSDGLPFFAMEYLEGEAITAYCRNRQLGVRERLELFLPVCSAVQYAHRLLVIHRDLKPGNILVGADGIPKLLDFGVGMLLGEHCEPAAGFSPVTERYASPEQLHGGPLSTATDVYSLGAILRALLDGMSPADDDPHAIASRAMEPMPGERYSTVEEMAADIRRYLAWFPVRARPASLWYRTRRLARRRRLRLTAAAAVAVSLVAGTTAALLQAHRAAVERQSAEARLAQILDFSDHSLTNVTGLLERLPGGLPARRELVGTLVASLEKLSRNAEHNVALRLQLAKAYLRLGQLQGGSEGASLGDYVGAIRIFRAGGALLDSLPPATLAQTGGLGIWLDLKQHAARLMAQNRDRAGAVALLRDAVAVAQATPAAGVALERSKAGLYLALARASLGNFEKTLEYGVDYQRAIQALLKVFPMDDDLRYDLTVAETQIGFTYLWAGRPEQGVEHYRASVQLREQLAQSHPHDEVYRRVLMLGYEHFASLQGSPLVPNLGNQEVARVYYEKARPIAEELAADRHNLLATADYQTLQMRAAALDVPARELAASLATLRQAAEFFSKLTASEQRNIYQPYEAQARLYSGHRLTAMRDYSGAMKEYQTAAAVMEDLVTRLPQEWDIVEKQVEAQGAMVRTSVLLNRRDASLEHSGRMMQLAQYAADNGGGNDLTESILARAYLAMAQAHRGFQDWADARAAAARSIAHATPLVTGRVWDPMARVVSEARTVLADCQGR